MKLVDCVKGTKVAIYGGARKMTVSLGGAEWWVNTHRLIGTVMSNDNGVQVLCEGPQGDMIEDSRYLCHPMQLRRIKSVEPLVPRASDHEKLRLAVRALKKVRKILITDGCGECSALWQNEYELKVVVQALKDLGEDSSVS